ncbi:MAG: hypothetical protein ABSE54_04085 [Smithella sp.]|jgi:hypothetical protein
MKQVKKIIGLKIIIISCLAVATSANSSGFVFNWQPFAVDADLSLKSSKREILIKNSSVTDLSALISEDQGDVLSSSADQNNVSAPKSEKKSMLENIKISGFQVDTFMMNRYDLYSHRDDEQISKLTDSLTSLIYDNSKIKSLETIGKTIEPQINFYFKF